MDTQDSDSNSVPVKEEQQSATTSGTESTTPKPEGMESTTEVQQRPLMFMQQQQQYASQQQPVVPTRMTADHQQMRMQMSHPMQQTVPGMNVAMNSQQHRPANQMNNSAIQQLSQALKNQSSTQTEQKVLSMLKANPALLASVLKLKTQRMQQQAAAQQQQE